MTLGPEYSKPRELVRDVPQSMRSEAALHVRGYNPPNWHTAQGVDRKRKAIEKRGLPNLHQWRFLTQTVARWRMPCGAYAMTKADLARTDLIAVSPLEMYLLGKARMRGFLERLRVLEIIPRDCPWCWKLEFQSDGYPHWHLLLGRKRKLTTKEMAKINEAWHLGRVNCEMIHSKGDAFSYTFKYAFKSVLQLLDSDEYDEFESPDSNIALPAWFLDYVGSRMVTVQADDGSKTRVAKPLTFSRARFWQTSKGFYTTALHRKPIEKKEQKTWSVPLRVRDLISIQARSLVVIARNHWGKYQASKVLRVSGSLEKLWNLIGWDSIQGGSVGLSVWSFVVPISLLKRKILCSHHLKSLCSQNSMTLRAAALLESSGQTLRTC